MGFNGKKKTSKGFNGELKDPFTNGKGSKGFDLDAYSSKKKKGKGFGGII